MALKKRSVKEDLKALRWPLALLAASIAATAGFYFSATYYWDDIRRQENNFYSELDFITSQVSAIEEAEQIIIENIDRFNEMQSNKVLDEENRVGMLAEIGRIREKYKFFPITVNLSEQQSRRLEYDSDVEDPQEQISLKGSRLQVQLPLLHEEDLTRFLGDFLRPGRLVVSNRCVINKVIINEEDLLSLIPHQQASCDFYWYTLIEEPIEEEVYYD